MRLLTLLSCQTVSFPSGSSSPCVRTVSGTSFTFCCLPTSSLHASWPMNWVFLLHLTKLCRPASNGFLSRFIWNQSTGVKYTGVKYTGGAVKGEYNWWRPRVIISWMEIGINTKRNIFTKYYSQAKREDVCDQKTNHIFLKRGCISFVPHGCMTYI